MSRTIAAIGAAALLFSASATAACDDAASPRQATVQEFLKLAALACHAGLENGSLPRELRDPQTCMFTLAAFLAAKTRASAEVRAEPVRTLCELHPTRTAAMTPLQETAARR